MASELVRWWAEEYLRRGGRVVPVQPGHKECFEKGWPAGQFTSADIPSHYNLGILTGGPSSTPDGCYYVCLDLDAPEVLARADEFFG